ncbi:MAG: hypothetical protein AAB116_03270 [Candidatus Poribacteria bacterium]
MARDSMFWLIDFLRVKMNDMESSIWADDEFQNYLDIHSIHVVREPLTYAPDQKLYYSTFGMLEADACLWDSDQPGAIEILNSIYTSNFVDGTFRFTKSQSGRYYMDAKSYNIHGAIAECLEQLAMDQNRAKVWNRGSVEFTHYDLLEMSRYHRGLAGLQNTNISRTYIKRG